MDLALQLLFTGIGIGAVYALVALGFVLIFRATNVVNFAQGEFSMVAAYLMVVFAVDLGWPYWLSFLLSLAGMALLGAIFNLGVYYPLRHRTFLPVIIATIGASILLANSVLAIYGPFRYAGQYTSESNASFDEMLRARDPESGIRDFEAVDTLARGIGFTLQADHRMPANNQTLVWKRLLSPS